MAPVADKKDTVRCTSNLAAFDVPNKYLSKSRNEAFLRELSNLRKNDVFCDVQLMSKGYCINV